ncbi:amidohydrolase [Pseudonocardia sp. MH-G8]|uniref:amidohydrolase family protein n=1 Tax=Pseudonocardia sp. MH-G8 TaxID=1854588 RepID=UPI000BA0DF77|nr:amidohydrolase family protein [Pseudonocardia sp. MH-G8]OZM77891.1 amidohydrolase [Pseudonocardia sp. MH-G8]
MTHPPEVLPGRRLDAHHHLWSAARVERGDYHWMPTDGPLRGDHLPEHLAPALEAAGVGGTIVVQAAPTVEETRFLLELAHATDFVLGVTGWVALDRPEDAELLAELAADEYLRAVRPMIHDLPDPNWVTRPQVRANLERLHELGLRFEALTRTEHLSAVAAALEAVPELPAVINHLSKPTYRPDADDQWRQWMLRLAERPNTWCKFSGMLTEVGRGWSAAQFQPYADFLFETFGADRVMFGSDWPVSSQLLGYTDVVALTDQLVPELGPAGVDSFWAHTAERFYGVRAPAATPPARSDQPLSS